MIGSEYDDYIFGMDGNDQLYGADGDDVLVGGFGNDTLVGGSGDDFLQGSSGINHLVGGSGNDKLIGGDGEDHFYFYFSTGNGQDTISSNYGADAGLDILELNIRNSDAVYYQTSDGSSLFITSQSDIADGSIDEGVLIEDYYTHHEYDLVDYIHFSDGYWAI